MHRRIIVAGALAALAVPATAQAHVTVQPSTAVPGSYTVENIRVPNEMDSGNTTKIEVKLPPGFPEVLYSQVPGWKVSFTKSKLATPIKTDDGEVDEQVDTVTFSGGKLPPHAFQDFPLSVQIPDGKVGAKMTFKAVQTYDNGKVVSWIGAPGSDTPAPQVTFIADPSKTAAPDATPAAAPAPPAVIKEKASNTGKTLAIIAIALAAVALAAGFRPRKA